MEVWWQCRGCGQDGYGPVTPDRCPFCGNFAFDARVVMDAASQDGAFVRRQHDQIEEFVRRTGHAPSGMHIEDGGDGE